MRATPRDLHREAAIQELIQHPGGIKPSKGTGAPTARVLTRRFFSCRGELLKFARQIKQSNDRWDRRSLRGERGRDHLRQRLAASSSARAHALALCSNGLAPLDHAELRNVFYLQPGLHGLDGSGHLKRSRDAFEIT